VAQEILEDIGGTLKFTAPVNTGAVAGSSVSCELFKPTSTTAYVTGTATQKNAITYLCSGVTDRDTVTVTSTSGMSVGDTYLWEDPDGWSQAVKIANLPGSNVVELESPLIADGDGGATLKGLDYEFDVSAANAADRNMNYRIEWSFTGKSAKFQTMFHVVRTLFDEPVTPAEAYRFAESNMAGAVVSWDAGRSIELATRASDKVRRELYASGVFPNLVGDPSAFKTAGLYALKHELAMLGMVPPGFDAGSYVATVNESLKSEIRQTLSSMTWIDKDNDGIVDNDETPGPYTIRVVRG